MRCCVVHLCAKAVADPDFRRRVLKKLTDHRFAAAGRDAVRYRSGRAKHPLPAGLAFDGAEVSSDAITLPHALVIEDPISALRTAALMVPAKAPMPSQWTWDSPPG